MDGDGRAQAHGMGDARQQFQFRLGFDVELADTARQRQTHLGFQLADTGIWPGSGVGNHRNALNQETLGVPVIGIGVPTVVGAGTIVHDAVAGVLESLEESEMDEFLGEVISPALESLYVTTKEIDEMVRRLAGVLAAGMNQAFSGEL